MKPYPKYRASGIEWIGEIPEHWSHIKLKFGIREKITDGPHESPQFMDEGIPFLSVDGIQDGELAFEGCRFISTDDHARFSEKCVVEENDILMGKAASIGKIARVKVPFSFSIWSPLALIKPDATILYPPFLEYGLKSLPSQAQIDILATSNTQRNISMDDIPKIVLSHPPRAEQQLIASYLDDKTRKIDTLIEKKQRLIELVMEQRTAIINQVVTKGIDPNVKMKDSGIEWIGEIPQHWNLKRLKYVVKGGLVNGLFKKREEFGQGTRLVNVINVYKEDCNVNESELERVTTTDSELENYRVSVGDIFFVRSSLKREGIAASACVRVISQPLVYECHLIKVSPDPKRVDYRFLINYLSCSTLRNRLLALSNTTTMTTIAQPSLSALEVLVPPVEEQKQIAEHIESMFAATRKTILRTESAIRLLQEYRAALISEAVTGKIDVRDHASGKNN